MISLKRRNIVANYDKLYLLINLIHTTYTSCVHHSVNHNAGVLVSYFWVFVIVVYLGVAPCYLGRWNLG